MKRLTTLEKYKPHWRLTESHWECWDPREGKMLFSRESSIGELAFCYRVIKTTLKAYPNQTRWVNGR